MVSPWFEPRTRARFGQGSVMGCANRSKSAAHRPEPRAADETPTATIADGNVALTPTSLSGPLLVKRHAAKIIPNPRSHTSRIDEAVWRVLRPDLVGGETEETREKEEERERRKKKGEKREDKINKKKKKRKKKKG